MNVISLMQGLWFSIRVENEEFVAFVTAGALRTRFNAHDKDRQALQQAYNQNKNQINSIAQRKFLNGTSRPIRLTSADF